MNSEQIGKYLILHKDGLLSSNEVANTLLYESLCEKELDIGFWTSIKSLPSEVQQSLHDLLQTIRAADYQWRPLLFISGSYPEFPNFPDRLHKICSLLAEQPGGRQEIH